MENKVFGIDLGTTNSAIAVFENGEARILKNMDGFDITPSVVFFTGVNSNGEDDSISGIQAKNAAASSPENVVQFVKRFMGYHGSQYNHIAPSGKEYTPEMISALILKKVCQDAERFVGGNAVKDVVVTVPAYFDDARRTATKQAGAIAGLNVLHTLNEPTAAAIAFGLDLSKKGKVLVYDLGGGTFDVTIMDIDGGNFNVIATDGDHELGGVNFDQKLMALMVRKLSEQECVIDDENDALLADIREKAEKAKIQLSNVQTARQFFTIDGKSYNLEITLEEFEKECESLMQQTQILVEDTLKNAKLKWEDIDELLLVGGSTRMPMVKKLLERLSGKEITYKVDPDTAVAQGAAIFASTLSQTEDKIGETSSDSNDIAQKIKISDVTSQSLGVISVDALDREHNTIIIPHNTPIPAKCSEDFETKFDNQQTIKVRVTEGDETDVEYVKIIGESVLNIPPYPKGSPIKIIFAYDIDQTVFIEVIDEVTKKSLGTFEIDRSSNLSEEEMKQASGIIAKTTVY